MGLAEQLESSDLPDAVTVKLVEDELVDRGRVYSYDADPEDWAYQTPSGSVLSYSDRWGWRARKTLRSELSDAVRIPSTAEKVFDEDYRLRFSETYSGIREDIEPIQEYLEEHGRSFWASHYDLDDEGYDIQWRGNTVTRKTRFHPFDDEMPVTAADDELAAMLERLRRKRTVLQTPSGTLLAETEYPTLEQHR